MLWLLLACAPAVDSAAPVSFTSLAEAWAQASADADPLADHRPPDDGCHPAGWGTEGVALEVETGICHYAWMVQPVARAMPAGSTLEGELWSGPLDAAEPAEAHAAILVDDRVLWEITVPIPGEPDIHPIEAELPEGVEAGTLLGFHLHNHGDNAWDLGPITLSGEP